MGKFGSFGSKLGQLEHPHYIAVSSTNRVLVSDSNNHRIQVFDVNGRELSSFGEEGSEDGQFKFPRYVWINFTLFSLRRLLAYFDLNKISISKFFNAWADYKEKIFSYYLYQQNYLKSGMIQLKDLFETFTSCIKRTTRVIRFSENQQTFINYCT